MTSEAEVWNPVVGYEGVYEVSSYGGVRSLDRTVLTKSGQVRNLKGVILKQTLSKTGYPVVDLYRDSKRKMSKVHRLVAEAFWGNPEEYPYVLHGDDNPTNNHKDNLRWGTAKENTQDCIRLGNFRGGGKFQEKKHCVNGHEFNDYNPQRKTTGESRCLECRRERYRASPMFKGNYNARKTECSKGHPLSGGNLRLERGGAKRVCLICRKDTWKRSNDKRKEARRRARELAPEEDN